MTPQQLRALALARARVRVEQEARQAAEPQSQEPNEAQQQEVGRLALQRETQNRMDPMGIARLTRPLVNTLTDPTRRAEVGHSFQNFVRDAQQLPNLDWGRVGRDTASAVQQGVQNLPQTLGNIATHVPQVVDAATIRPFREEEEAQQRLDLARVLGTDQAAPAQQANAAAANAGLNTAAAFIGGGSAVRTGLTAAALDAPFALSRGEGSLQERLPQALTEIGGVGVTGGAIQAGVNAIPRVLRPPSRANQRAADFAEAGVDPTLAATQQGAAAGATKMISENLLAGAGARRRLQSSLDQTSGRARELAQQAGDVNPREVVGENVQAGVRRFSQDRNAPNPRPRADPRSVSVREWSFPAKAEALYDDVFERLANDEAAMAGQVDGPVLALDATRRTLGDIETRVHGPASREAMRSPKVEEIQRALESDAAIGELRFHDLREWRRWVREAQRDEGLRQGVSNADLQRLERALTEDIYTSAQLIGGQAARDLHQIDRWYRAGTRRIQIALEPFHQGGGAQAYRRIIDLASQRGRQNTRQLSQLRASLRPDEWRQVSAAVIDELGNPSFGAPNVLEHGAFSVDKFVTSYARLSPEGRGLLFGDLAPQMETLARVAGHQKGVEAMANRSRSGVNVQNVGMGLAVVNPASTGYALATLAGMAITGEMLTNPAFVRWLTSAPRGGRVAGIRGQISALARLAARDPALAPAAAQLQARQSELAPAANDNLGDSRRQRAAASR